MRLLYVDISQYGYHTDAYYYAKHLGKNMEVTYIGCHNGKKEIPAENVRVIYAPCRGNKLMMHFCFYKACIRELRANKYDCVFICYTIFCSILRMMFPKQTMLVDVRTGYVEPSKIVNAIFNGLMKIELSFFKHVSFISHELAAHLKFNRPYEMIPVGAEHVASIPPKHYDKLALLYVGTFFNRHMDITIRGFKKFIDGFDHSIPVSYTLIGFGPEAEIKKVQDEIERLGLTSYIQFKGEVRYPELESYFHDSTVGVSFVPVTPHYNCQPPTKNYEYLMYGLPLLATATTFNRNFVKPEFGVVIEDTEDGFCEGLLELVAKIKTFDSDVIRSVALKYSYVTIVGEILEPYIRSKVISK
jgi:hypothetical protein